MADHHTLAKTAASGHREETSEVLVQTAMRFGVATAENSFRIATKALKEIDEKCPS